MLLHRCCGLPVKMLDFTAHPVSSALWVWLGVVLLLLNPLRPGALWLPKALKSLPKVHWRT